MTHRLAIVAACPFPSPQGSQVFVEQMAEALAARGHVVHLLTYGQGAPYLGKGFRHHRVRRLPGDDAMRSGPRLVKPVLDAMLAVKLRRLVLDERIERIHAHNYEATIAALAVRAVTGVPVVYHSHNLMEDELETYFDTSTARGLARRFGRTLDRTIPRRADHAVALCEFSARRLREHGVAAAQLSVVPPAVRDDGPLDPSPEARAAARATLGLPADATVVGYCGNVDAYQNLELAVAALQELQVSGLARRHRLILVIGTHATVSARSLVRVAALGQHGRVLELVGYSHARRLLAAADLLLLPRRLGSGYPVKLLNYMSAGKPVITAGCGAKVLTDGVDGRVVADHDVAGLARAVVELATMPELAARLGRAGRETFLGSLTWEHVLPRIEAIYERLPRRQAASALAEGTSV